MAKALKTAALVVGAVALVATGVGAAMGAAAAASTIVAGVASVATIATVAGVAAGVLSLAATLTAKKPSAADATGSQTSFSADPDAGIPAALGRTGTAGNIVARFGFDTRDAGDNDRQSFVSVLSLGPVAEIEATLGVDRSPVSFNGAGQAIGQFSGYMWRQVQLGLLAGAALGFGAGAGSPPGWTPQHKLSGKAATTWTLRFDTKSKLYQNGVPAPMNVIRGRLVYDPRKDSTYPGGSGPHRMADPADRAAYDAAVATWEWSENPYLHGLAFVHGYWQRDMANATSDWQRVMGMGAPAAGIDVAAFVEGANVADANGWKVGGVIYSGDDKWGSLKKILQAGMGEPMPLGAKISCLVNAPRVSLATIGIDDVIGEASVGATQPRRERINTITPRFRLEENNWQLLPGAPLSVTEHVITDKGKRSKTQDYPLIQSAAQIGTAVRYDIENAREFGPIVLPCKLVWMGYKPGDCVTAMLPELGLNGQPILLLNRSLAPAGGVVTLTARSETPAKHPYALGQTATPPPTAGVTGPYLVPVPGETAWTISGTDLTANGATVPALIVTGAVDTGTAESIIFEYRPFVTGQPADLAWRGASPEPVGTTRKDITSVAPGTAYEVAVSYRARGVIGARRVLGPVTTAGTALDFDNVHGPNKPDNNATDSSKPDSPFGSDGTVGGTIDHIAAIDAAVAEAEQRLEVIEQDLSADAIGAAASRAAAEAARDAAIAARDNALTAREQSLAARDAAGTARTAAEDAARQSALSQTDAAGSATTASGQATIATQKADAAGQSATIASGKAEIATTKAGEAQTSATSAATSQADALGSKNAAFTSQEAAARSAGTAGGHADAASRSSTSAAASESVAGQKASAANDSAVVASTKAGQASTSATAAATSETNAAGSANTASRDAGLAAQSKIDAGNSAQASATSATTAGTKATEAGNSATAANQSKLDAQSARDGAAASAGVSGQQAVIATDKAAAASASAGLSAGYATQASQTLAKIEDVDGVFATELRSQAQRTSTVEATARDITAKATQQAGAIATLEGKSAAYVKIIADAGNGRAALSLWSDQYGGAWQLTGNGLIDGGLTINGTVTALAFNGPSMFREGQASWSGSVSPDLGQTVAVGWSLGLPTIPAGRGRFIYEFTFEMTTNAGTSEFGGLDGQGRSVRTFYVADGGGLILQAVDGQGNIYAVRPNASDRVLASTDFAPTFTASVRRGARNETQDGGDYVTHYIAATYTLTRINLKVTWVAV
jgi:hypothetical protein